MRDGIRLTLASLALIVSGQALALDFSSVATPAILYDGPSALARKLYIISAGTPVEVVVSLEKWVKVRDMSGSLTWIERSALSPKRTLEVSDAQIDVRQQPADDAPVAFEAAKNVVLDMLQPPADGWIKVRHKDGLVGYVKVGQVWGL